MTNPPAARPILVLSSVFLLAGVVGYALWIAGGALVRDGNWIGVDFQVYYRASRVLANGDNIYTAGISPPYVYPPLLALLINPLAFLPIAPATIIWKTLQHICLLIAGVLLTRLSPAGIRPLVAGVLALNLLLAPLHDEIRVGESNSLVLALIVAALYLALQGGPKSAIVGGLLLALAVSIKVLPVLVLVYFWWRGPRTLAAWAFGGFIALQLLTLLLVPSNLLQYWLVEFPGLFGQAFPYLDNQSLNAFFSRALLPSDPAYPNVQLANGEALRPILAWIANLLVLGAAAWALWTTRPPANNHTQPASRNTRLLLEAGIVLLTTHLVSGSTWLHHLIALSVPVAGLLGLWWLRWRAGHLSQANTALAAGGLVTAGIILAIKPEDWLSLAGKLAPNNIPLALIASSLPMLVVIGMWIAVWRALTYLTRLDGYMPDPTKSYVVTSATQPPPLR